MKRLKRWVVGALLASLPIQPAGASINDVLQRNASYEQALKYEASADKTITPAKVIRWMMNLRGQALAAPSPTEFQPTVNVHNGQVRVVAAIAYKF